MDVGLHNPGLPLTILRCALKEGKLSHSPQGPGIASDGSCDVVAAVGIKKTSEPWLMLLSD